MTTTGRGNPPSAGGSGGRARRVEDLPSSPAAERNKEPILNVLRRVLPGAGIVLEIASGTGQHVAHFAAAMPRLKWQPTEPDENLLAAIRRRVESSPARNVLPPLRLDVLERPWPTARADAIVCINMIHIAPWDAAVALFRGAGETLRDPSPLVLYGPFVVPGKPTAPSNEAFDASLKARNPEWGVRDLDSVAATAASRGLRLEQTVEMPANNLIVVFRRA